MKCLQYFIAPKMILSAEGYRKPEKGGTQIWIKFKSMGRLGTTSSVGSSKLDSSATWFKSRGYRDTAMSMLPVSDLLFAARGEVSCAIISQSVSENPLYQASFEWYSYLVTSLWCEIVRRIRISNDENVWLLMSWKRGEKMTNPFEETRKFHRLYWVFNQLFIVSLIDWLIGYSSWLCHYLLHALAWALISIQMIKTINRISQTINRTITKLTIRIVRTINRWWIIHMPICTAINSIVHLWWTNQSIITISQVHCLIQFDWMTLQLSFIVDWCQVTRC